MSNIKKPFCKVCQDAGKPESDYTSHWVKSLPDRTGKSSITCPTLLSNECRYCFKLGHTAKFCPVLEKNKKDKERAERKITYKVEEPQKKTEKKKSIFNGFAAFQVDSDSEEEENVKVSTLPNIVVEEFPALGTPVKQHVAVHLPSVKQEVKIGWANAVAKPKPKMEEESPRLPQTKKAPETTQVQFKLRASEMNWADLSDSDSDEDIEGMVAPTPVLRGPPMPTTMMPGWSNNLSADDDDW